MTQKRVELTTARLLVRTPGENDVHDIFALMNDQEIAASTGFRPMSTPSEAEGKIRRAMANLNMFGIAKKEHPARIVGVFEVSPHCKNTTSGEKHNYEICYFLHESTRGRGYMTEVVEAMKRYLFTERKADSLTIAVLPRNDKSRRVALKNGFTYEGLEKKCGVTYLDEVVDLEYYTLTKEEYLNPGKKVDKESVQILEKQKWINDGGILYPIPGYATLLPCPGSGIFRIYEDTVKRRLGLEKIDEAEKTFDEERETLLKMIDGVYNNTRKLYILTTNKLTIDENLLGRPGRIRYIKEFANLSAQAINDIIDDNLRDTSLKAGILKLVDSLEISTIDILKSIIEECNIMGTVPEDLMLNIPRAKYKIQVVSFDSLDISRHQELQEYIKSRLAYGETVADWLRQTAKPDEEEKKPKKNRDLIEEEFDCSVDIRLQASVSPMIYLGQHLRYGTVSGAPDKYGFFTLESEWEGTTLCCVGDNGARPSLYRGNLF